jgi:hypothetical protein
MINAWASLGSHLIALRAALAESEKQARKTPPRTLAKERDRVQAAREELPRLRQSINETERMRFSLRWTLEIAGAFGGSDAPPSIVDAMGGQRERRP